MKKVFRTSVVISAILLTVSALFLVVFAITQYKKGNNVTAYHRFYKMENGKRTFNWLGILSPVQVESQKYTDTVVTFSFKVPYPVAPKFEIVAPSDNVEAQVAATLANLLADSIEKFKFDLLLDYDKQAVAVRKAQGIKNFSITTPEIYFSAHGTASPEAIKNGFMASIQPGVLEPENAQVAQARVERTTPLIVENLHAKGYDSVTVTGITWNEEQFSETDETDSLYVVASLPDMRYVIIDGHARLRQVTVIPATAPVAFPIELLSLLGLIALGWFLYSLYKKPSAIVVKEYAIEETPQFVYTRRAPEKGTEWMNWLLIGLIIVCLGIVALIIYFWNYFFAFFGAIGFYLLIRWFMNFVSRNSGPAIGWFLKQRAYWATKPWTCKVAALWFVLTFPTAVAALITYLLGYWHIC